VAEQFDVTIIGSGPGGYVAAVRAGQLGLKTAIIEKEPGAKLGGTCGLRGCIPTKALLNAAHLYQKAGEFEKYGLKAEGLSYDFPAVQKYKSGIVDKNAAGVNVPDEEEQGHGVRRLRQDHQQEQGRGHARGRQEGNDRHQEHHYRDLGPSFARSPGFETDGKQVVNSDHILELQSVPKSMIVMGSGAVGVEFASVYARFGCDTTVVELLDRIVPLEDEEVSKELLRSFKKQGIKCETGLKLDKLEKTKKGVKVSGKNAKGDTVTLEADMLLVAGRPHAVSRGTRS
jgi:dihydrolipoamide dehydrogenase